MSATPSLSSILSSGADLNALLERAVPAHLGSVRLEQLQRKLTAAALQVVADWLSEQARMLSEEPRRAAEDDARTATAGHATQMRPRLLVQPTTLLPLTPK